MEVVRDLGIFGRKDGWESTGGKKRARLDLQRNGPHHS